MDASARDALRVLRPATAHGPPIYALARYQDAARAVVLAYKERGRRDLAEPLGRLLGSVLTRLPGVCPAPEGTWWLVPAPSRASAARRRGGQHMLRLARRCAVGLAAAGQPAAVAPALRIRAGARDSVGLDETARMANLAGRLVLRPNGLPPAGTPVVLLDDVVTTGSTAAACVRTLRLGGLSVSAVLSLTATS